MSEGCSIWLMRFISHSHHHADNVLNDPRRRHLYEEVIEAITSLSDNELLTKHRSRPNGGLHSSLAPSINALLKEKFVARGWSAESSIFQGEEYGGDNAEKVWRLDFAKEAVSIEVAFNHGEAIAWNLLKPVLASEINHVKKAIDTEVGILITATRAMKAAGCFDNAVGEYEKVLRYLTPLDRMLTVPVLIIGLEPPEGFQLEEKYPLKNHPDWGKVIHP